MLARSWVISLAVLSIWALAAAARGDDVKTYDQDGVTYQETHRVTQRPISETHYETRQQTVYVEQYQTQMQSVPRTYQVPVTQYVWEPYWVNRWNPFAQAYIAYRYVPQVHWETRTDTVQTPVVVRNVVPQQQTVQVPITTQRMVQDEQISRVAIAMKPAAPGSTAGASAVAGGAPTTSDPFAAGNPSAPSAASSASQPPTESAWHAADGVQRQ